MKVMQMFMLIRSKIETACQKSSFVRKANLINALPSCRISEVKKCLIKNVYFHCG